MSEENSPNATAANVRDSGLTSSEAAAGNSLDDDEYDDIISLYDDIDEHAVNLYEGLEKSVSNPVPQPQATNNYATLGAVEWDDTSQSSENIEMSELYADPDAVSQPLSNSSTLSSFRIRRHVSAGLLLGSVTNNIKGKN